MDSVGQDAALIQLTCCELHFSSHWCRLSVLLVQHSPAVTSLRATWLLRAMLLFVLLTGLDFNLVSTAEQQQW